MRSMGVGALVKTQQWWRAPTTTRCAGGPPPRAGEDRGPQISHLVKSLIINPAVALALATTPGIPAPGCVAAPAR